MSANTKKRLTICLLAGLSAYCGYHLFLRVQAILSRPEQIPHFHVEFWMLMAIDLVGIWFYSRTALGVHRMNFDDKQIRLFQIFSGVFAGSFTDYLWFCLFNTVSVVSYQWIAQNCLVPAAAFAAAIAVTRMSGWRIGFRRLILAFAVTALLFAAIHLGRKLGIANVDPLLLLAGGAFLVFACFFRSLPP